MKKVLFILLCLSSAASLSAQDSQTGYNFLRLPVSAHAAALGGDNISVIEDDETLIFNNPALLSSVSDKTLNLNYMNYMSGVNCASAAYDIVYNDKATFAFSGQYIDYGSMKEMDENNVQTGTFSAKDISLAAYLSYILGKKFVGGITAKFITSYIGDYNSMAVGIDLGINYYDDEKDLSVSAVAKNLGGQIKAYDEEYESMPLDLQVGLTKRFPHMPFRVSATMTDLNHWNYEFIKHAILGVDLILSDNIWIGGGYNFRRVDEMKISNADDDTSSSHGAGLSIGAGVNMDRFKLNVAYGKYHVSSNSLVINAAFNL